MRRESAEDLSEHEFGEACILPGTSESSGSSKEGGETDRVLERTGGAEDQLSGT